MAKNKKLELAEQIEKLIVDGQKEVLGQIQIMRDEMRNGHDELRTGLDEVSGGLDGLREGQKQIIDWVRRIDKKHDVNADAQYDLLRDVKKDVGEVKEKLETHLRVPHAV